MHWPCIVSKASFPRLRIAMQGARSTKFAVCRSSLRVTNVVEQIVFRHRKDLVIAAAVYCHAAGLMIQHGYRNPSASRNQYAPNWDWNSRYKDEWMFEYVRYLFRLITVYILTLMIRASRLKIHWENSTGHSLHRPALHGVGIY